MTFVTFDVCHIITFVGYEVCRIMTFFGYDVCRIMMFVAYDIFECVAYRVCRSAVLCASQTLTSCGLRVLPVIRFTKPNNQRQSVVTNTVLFLGSLPSKIL